MLAACHPRRGTPAHPGTSSEDYLEQNVAVAGIQLSDKEYDELGSL
jgi:hypothetical protein